MMRYLIYHKAKRFLGSKSVIFIGNLEQLFLLEELKLLRDEPFVNSGDIKKTVIERYVDEKLPKEIS